jgi:pectate lyase
MARRMSLLHFIYCAVASALSVMLCVEAAARASSTRTAFPGAEGWAATTPGGRGGRIIKVTTLAASGPGSLREAIEAKGPRIVVFEVGGVIDLDHGFFAIEEPFITVAGQTAPSPGITIIRGMGVGIITHDVIVQHVRVRPGDAGERKAGGWLSDGIRTERGAHDVIIDHCTLAWATDKNLAVSGDRFQGSTPDEWRANTSHRITVSNNIIAEGLSLSTHWKVEHSKGALIHDNVTDLTIVGNLFAHNYERNPLFKGGVRGVIVNNFIYDPGPRAIHYNLIADDWGDRPYQLGQMVAVGNVVRAGPSTPTPVAFLEIGGAGNLEYYARDNIAVDQLGRPLPMQGRYTTARALVIEVRKPPLWPDGLEAMPAADVEVAILKSAGARPWDRDYQDARLIADVSEGRGKIIDSQEEVHGYLEAKSTRRDFNPDDWDLETMTPLRPDVLDGAQKNQTLMFAPGQLLPQYR